MKISTSLATGLGVFLLAGAANAATVDYVAHLTGAQSQNVTTSTATADALLTYDDVAKTLTGVVSYPGANGGTGFTILPTGGHLKSGACTEPGSIISALTLESVSKPEGGALSLNNTTPLDDDQVAALQSGKLFLTIENTTYPSPESEIRGQIVASGAANDLCASELAAEDAGTVQPGVDAGTTPPPVATTPVTTDDGGCNTTGSSSPGSNAALALGLGLALYGIARKRKQA